MLKVIGKYLRLMRDHDFSYQYSDDPEFWAAENRKGCELKRLEQLLSATAKGRWIVMQAKRKYGYV
jgi:hypothetical protein